MNTKKKDWISVILLAVAIAPIGMYAVVGSAFLPDVLQANDPPLMISRIISKISTTTGLSFAAATKIIFSGSSYVAAILFVLRTRSRRMETEKQRESQPPPGN